MRIKLTNKFWNPQIERIGSQELVRIQNEKLRKTLRYVKENSRFYADKLRKAHVDIDLIKSRADLSKMPFTDKLELTDSYPFGLLAVPMDDVCRFHATSGTTGNPTVVAYTRNDLDNWAECIARCLTMTGVREGDIFQIILGYGLFTGGLGFHYGAELVGAIIIPASTGNSNRQIKLMKDLKVAAFTGTPSYTLYLAEVSREMGIEPEKDLQIKSISCGAEAWSENMRRKIEAEFGCYTYNSYGLAEACGPGVAFECIYQNGLHVWADHFIIEIVDPKTGENVNIEEEGEIVLTTLSKEAIPLLRYRTRDVARIIDEKTCECLRTHPKISWITGRTDDMIKVKGVNIFPSQVEHVLMGIPKVENNYQLMVTREKHMDKLTLKIEVAPDVFSLESKAIISLKRKILDALESTLGLKVSVKLLPPSSLPRSEGKAKRVQDLRKY